MRRLWFETPDHGPTRPVIRRRWSACLDCIVSVSDSWIGLALIVVGVAGVVVAAATLH